MSVLPDRLPPEEIGAEVDAFERRYGAASLTLAAHAAVADRLRPDMLALIRVNFLEGADRFQPALDADVLFGPLCTHQGGGIYEMHEGVRSFLFGVLDRQYRLDRVGRFRSQEVGRMIRQYLAGLPQPANDTSGHETQFRQQNLWRVLAIDDPDAAFRHIYETTRDRLEQPRDKLVHAPRSGGIISVAKDVLASFEQDVRYLNAIDLIADDRAEEGIALLEFLSETGFEPEDPRVPTPGALMEEERVFAAQRRYVISGGSHVEVGANAESENKLSGHLELDVSKLDLRDTPITRAVRSGNLNVVREAIRAHRGFIDQIDRFGYAPLHHAVRQGREDIARLLIEEGADPEVRTAHDGTALIMTGFHGMTDFARLLLERRVDPCHANSKNSTALMMACYYGHRNLVELLLDQPRVDEVHIALENYDGHDALHWAVCSGDQAIVDFLLARGANTGIESGPRFNLLHCAALSQTREMVIRILTLGFPVDARDGRGWTALHMACCDRPSLEIVELLLECGADPYLPTIHGWTPSRLAANWDNADILAALAGYQKFTIRHAADAAYAGAIRSLSYLVDDQGISIDAKTWIDSLVKSDKPEAFDFLLTRHELFDTDFATLFKKAVEFGKPAILRHVGEAGHDLPPVPEKKESWAHVVDMKAEKRDATIVELLSFPAPVAELTGDAHFLVTAAKDGLTETVEVLLERGASVNAKEQNNMSPLGAAISAKQVEMARRLLDAGARPDMPVGGRGEPPSFLADLDGLTLLAERGANLEARSLNGATLLHMLAGRTDRLVELAFVLDKVPLVSDTDHTGQTPLHIAARTGTLEAARHLIEAGAPLEIAAHDGFTPYLRALESGRLEMTDLLVSAGARRDARTHGGWSALHIAAERGEAELVRTLWPLLGARDRPAAQPPRTAMQVAAEVGASDVIEILLELGVDPDNRAGRTPRPLFLAIEAGAIGTAKRLVEAGADVSTPDLRTGLDAHAAARTYSQRHHWIAKNARADVDDLLEAILKARLSRE